MAEIIARNICAVVRKLKPGASPSCSAFGAELAGKKPFRNDVEILELFQELVIEQRDLCICRGHTLCTIGGSLRFRSALQYSFNDGVGIDALGFALEVQKHAVPQSSIRDGADVLA